MGTTEQADEKERGKTDIRHIQQQKWEPVDFTRTDPAKHYPILKLQKHRFSYAYTLPQGDAPYGLIERQRNAPFTSKELEEQDEQMGIDHLKWVSDQHGHIIGDGAVIVFAQLMRESLRLQTIYSASVVRNARPSWARRVMKACSARTLPERF